MDMNNTKPLASQPAIPTSELWRALLEIYNHYLRSELADYRYLPDVIRPPRRVREAVEILDCWLDMAVSEGWLEEAHEQRD